MTSTHIGEFSALATAFCWTATAFFFQYAARRLGTLTLNLIRLLAAFDVECVPFPPERKAIDIGDYYADCSAYHNATGWTPQIDLADGLARTVDFFRTHWNRYLLQP